MNRELTKDIFEDAVMRSDVPVLVDFYAGWCRWCRVMEPNVDKLAEEVEEAGSARVFKANIDELPEIAEKMSVKTVPTLIVFRNGQETARKTGTKTFRAMRKMLLGE